MPPPTITPRPRPTDYNNSRDFYARANNFSSLRILKPEISDVVVRKPSWNGTETIFRPFPCPNYENPAAEFEPYRADPGGENYVTDWIRRYACAWNVGVGEKLIYLIKKQPDDSRPFDPRDSPLGILNRGLQKAIAAQKASAPWMSLLLGGQGKSPALSKPSYVCLMQGMLVKISDKDTFNQLKGLPPMGWAPRDPVVLMITGATGIKLDKMLQEEYPNYRGDPGDFEARYIHGDPVSPDHGRYFHFFEEGKGKQQVQQVSMDVLDGGQSDHGFGGSRSNGESFKGYDIFISKDGGMPGWNAHLNRSADPSKKRPSQVDIIRHQWRWWEQILYFPTEAEQARMLCEVFPLDLCLYSFGDISRDWLPDDVHQRLANARTMVMSGQSPAQPADGPNPNMGTASPGDAMPWDTAPWDNPAAIGNGPATPFDQLGQGAPWAQNSQSSSGLPTTAQPNGPAPGDMPAPATPPSPAPGPMPAPSPTSVAASATQGVPADAAVPAGTVPAGPGVRVDTFGVPPTPAPGSVPAPTPGPSTPDANTAQTLARLAAARDAARR
jgi:hypothetical protein